MVLKNQLTSFGGLTRWALGGSCPRRPWPSCPELRRRRAPGFLLGHGEPFLLWKLGEKPGEPDELGWFCSWFWPYSICLLIFNQDIKISRNRMIYYDIFLDVMDRMIGFQQAWRLLTFNQTIFGIWLDPSSCRALRCLGANGKMLGRSLDEKSQGCLIHCYGYINFFFEKKISCKMM